MLSSLRSPEGGRSYGRFHIRRNARMRLLPARLARLTRDFAIIFVRESFFAAAGTIPAARSAAVAAAITAAATTVTAAAPTAATAATRSARSAAAGFGFRAGFVYFQIAASDVFAVQRCDGFCCFG